MRAKLAELHPKAFFLDTWKRIDAEVAAEQEADEKSAFDWEPLILFCAATVFLTVMEYWGGGRAYDAFVEHLEFKQWISVESMVAFENWHYHDLTYHAWWGAWRVLGFFILPVLVIKLQKKACARLWPVV